MSHAVAQLRTRTIWQAPSAGSVRSSQLEQTRFDDFLTLEEMLSTKGEMI